MRLAAQSALAYLLHLAQALAHRWRQLKACGAKAINSMATGILRHVWRPATNALSGMAGGSRRAARV